MIIFSAFSLVVFSRASGRRFGLRMPAGKDWWFLLPIIILAAFANGAYIPQRVFPIVDLEETLIIMMLTIPLGSELLFRSLVHGILAKGASIQSCRSEWFFSYPAVASAILYAAFVAYLVLLPIILQGALSVKVAVVCVFAAIVFGMAAGFVRERSQSIIPAILFHAAAMSFFVILNLI